MARAHGVRFRAGEKPKRNERVPQLVDVHGGCAGKRPGQKAGGQSKISGSFVAARPDASLSLYPAGDVGYYAVITSIFDLCRASMNSAGARLSVISRWTPERGPMRDRLLRPSLLKSATTFTSLETRIITVLSWASSKSGVEGPSSRSKPSTARKRRSAWNSLSMVSAWGPTNEPETGRNSPPIIITDSVEASTHSD